MMLLKKFNSYFSNIALNLDIKVIGNYSTCERSETDPVLMSISKYSEHPSIVAINTNCLSDENHCFNTLSNQDIQKVVNDIDVSKATSSQNIPTSPIKIFWKLSMILMWAKLHLPKIYQPLQPRHSESCQWYWCEQSYIFPKYTNLSNQDILKVVNDIDVSKATSSQNIPTSPIKTFWKLSMILMWAKLHLPKIYQPLQSRHSESCQWYWCEQSYIFPKYTNLSNQDILKVVNDIDVSKATSSQNIPTSPIKTFWKLSMILMWAKLHLDKIYQPLQSRHSESCQWYWCEQSYIFPKYTNLSNQDILKVVNDIDVNKATSWQNIPTSPIKTFWKLSMILMWAKQHLDKIYQPLQSRHSESCQSYWCEQSYILTKYTNLSNQDILKVVNDIDVSKATSWQNIPISPIKTFWKLSMTLMWAKLHLPKIYQPLQSRHSESCQWYWCEQSYILTKYSNLSNQDIQKVVNDIDVNKATSWQNIPTSPIKTFWKLSMILMWVKLHLDKIYQPLQSRHSESWLSMILMWTKLHLDKIYQPLQSRHSESCQWYWCEQSNILTKYTNLSNQDILKVVNDIDVSKATSWRNIPTSPIKIFWKLSMILMWTKLHLDKIYQPLQSRHSESCQWYWCEQSYIFPKYTTLSNQDILKVVNDIDVSKATSWQNIPTSPIKTFWKLLSMILMWAKLHLDKIYQPLQSRHSESCQWYWCEQSYILTKYTNLSNQDILKVVNDIDVNKATSWQNIPTSPIKTFWKLSMILMWVKLHLDKIYQPLQSRHSESWLSMILMWTKLHLDKIYQPLQSRHSESCQWYWCE